ncbi:MAG: type III-A CRISPR-associated RAMP protein Csm3 [Deltaproteobacteria bacterium]|nr:type III-A CRISPR-associated RAMP protein Csm3 [Deltaproteobacteria bacterium]
MIGSRSEICKVFGAHKNTHHNLGSTRILVRDACFSNETRKAYKAMMEEKGTSYIEKKVENIVNRKTGTAEHPRSQERVPAGAKFDFEIVLQLFDTDNENELVEFVKDGLKNVQMTYLGGFGSRGSGQVKFVELTLDGQSFKL